MSICHCRYATLTKGHEPGCIHYEEPMTEQLTREVILMDRTNEVGDDGMPIVQEVTRFELTEEQFGTCAIIKWNSEYYVFSADIWSVHHVIAYVKNGILRL